MELILQNSTTFSELMVHSLRLLWCKDRHMRVCIKTNVACMRSIYAANDLARACNDPQLWDFNIFTGQINHCAAFTAKLKSSEVTLIWNSVYRNDVQPHTQMLTDSEASADLFLRWRKTRISPSVRWIRPLTWRRLISYVIFFSVEKTSFFCFVFFFNTNKHQIQKSSWTGTKLRYDHHILSASLSFVIFL